MKIGIITLNGLFNYGNRLQNYALKEYIKQLSDDIIVDNIWWGKKFELNDQSIYNFQNIRRFIVNRHNFREKIGEIFFVDKIKEYNFKKFNDKYINTVYCSSIKEEIEYKYDFFIAGSDQIWNPYWIENNGYNELLLFTEPQKRIAYAASMGVDRIPDNSKELYSKAFSEMDKISVREHAGAAIVKELTGKEVPVLVDPTMLLSKKQWISISEKPYWLQKGKYILIIYLGEIPDFVKIYISNVAEKYKLKVINLMNKSIWEQYVTGPEGFLYLMEHAELVMTDSFHATVFSIIMQTPFFNWSRKGAMGMNMDTRIDTLLGLFGYNDRKINENTLEKINNPFEIDFENSVRVLGIEQNKSRKFLLSAIGRK